MRKEVDGNVAVGLVDGLVCVSLTAPGEPDIIMRLPKYLAAELAGRIASVSELAPDSCPAPPRESGNGGGA